VKNQVDLPKNGAEKERWVTELEQELKQVREVAATETRKLENKLAEEKRKAKQATTQFNASTIGNVEVLCW
jgi:hypothetical protein